MQALIIDDSKAVRRILCGLLREIGFDVVEASHGLEGLDRLRQQPRPDLVLVDLNMPHMNGLEFVAAVRGNPAYNAVRIVMATSETEMDQVATALALGVDEYVMKPFDREAILNKLQWLQLV